MITDIVIVVAAALLIGVYVSWRAGRSDRLHARVEMARAALDVTDPEPLPPGHPLWSLSGVFITPHVAASTPVSRQRAARLVREQAEAYARGGPLRNVISGAY